VAVQAQINDQTVSVLLDSVRSLLSHTGSRPGRITGRAASPGRVTVQAAGHGGHREGARPALDQETQARRPSNDV